MPSSRSAANARLSASAPPSSRTTQRTPPASPRRDLTRRRLRPRSGAPRALASENSPTPASSSGERASSSRSLRASRSAARSVPGGAVTAPAARRAASARCRRAAGRARGRAWRAGSSPSRAAPRSARRAARSRRRRARRAARRAAAGRGSCDERTRHAEALTLALREVASPHRRRGRRAPLARALRAPPCLRARTGARASTRFSLAVRPSQTSGRCDEVADAPSQRRPRGRRRDIVEPRLASRRPQQARDDAQQRRLARAVLTEQRERRGRLHAQLDPAQHAALAEVVLDPQELDDRRGHGRGRSGDRCVERDGREVQDGDHAVDREEGGVDAREVVRPRRASSRSRAARRRARRRRSRRDRGPASSPTATSSATAATWATRTSVSAGPRPKSAGSECRPCARSMSSPAWRR